MSARTIVAVRQVIYTMLTVPPLTYVINNGSPQTLPVANVYSMAPYDMVQDAEKPDPLVNFDVSGHGRDSLALKDEHLIVKFWASTESNDEDTVVEILSAINTLFESPNAEGVNPLSRAATATTLAATIREVRDAGSGAPKYEAVSQRIWADASYRVIAI